MEKIERNELIEFLKKISENALTKELEIEVPLGLPHGVVGIRPQIVKVDGDILPYLFRRALKK